MKKSPFLDIYISLNHRNFRLPFRVFVDREFFESNSSELVTVMNLSHMERYNAINIFVHNLYKVIRLINLDYSSRLP